MRIEQPVTVPAKTYEALWISRVGGVFPTPQKAASVNPETGEPTIEVVQRDGILEVVVVPFNELPDGQYELSQVPQVKKIAVTALMQKPGVYQAVTTILQALLSEG